MLVAGRRGPPDEHEAIRALLATQHFEQINQIVLNFVALTFILNLDDLILANPLTACLSAGRTLSRQMA